MFPSIPGHFQRFRKSGRCAFSVLEPNASRRVEPRLHSLQFFERKILVEPPRTQKARKRKLPIQCKKVSFSKSISCEYIKLTSALLSISQKTAPLSAILQNLGGRCDLRG